MNKRFLALFADDVTHVPTVGADASDAYLPSVGAYNAYYVVAFELTFRCGHSHRQNAGGLAFDVWPRRRLD